MASAKIQLCIKCTDTTLEVYRSFLTLRVWVISATVFSTWVAIFLIDASNFNGFAIGICAILLLFSVYFLIRSWVATEDELRVMKLESEQIQLSAGFGAKPQVYSQQAVVKLVLVSRWVEKYSSESSYARNVGLVFLRDHSLVRLPFYIDPVALTPLKHRYFAIDLAGINLIELHQLIGRQFGEQFPVEIYHKIKFDHTNGQEMYE